MQASHSADRMAAAGLVAFGALLVGATLGAARAPAGLLLVAALIGAIAVYLLASPESGVVLGIVLLYCGAPAVAVTAHGLPTALGLAVPLIFAVPLASKLIRREGFVISTGVRWMLVLVVVQILAALAAQHQEAAQRALLTFFVEGVVLYFLIVNVVRTPQAVRRGVWAVIGAGAFLAGVAVLQQLSGQADQRFFGFAQLDTAYLRGNVDVFRAQGPVADANYFAQLLVPVVALGLVAVWRSPTRAQRLAGGAAAAVCVMAIAFTYSRGAAVALLAVLLGLAFFRYIRGAHTAAVGVLIVLVVLLVPGYSERLGTIAGAAGSVQATTASSSDDFSAAARATENKAALLVFRDYPLLGVGQAGFERVYQQYAPRAGGAIHTRNSSSARKKDIKAGLAPEREAHNFFLDIAASMGIAGLFGYCTIILITLHQLLRARRMCLATKPESEGLATGLLLAVIGYMTAALFLSLAFERYFWLVIGLAGAAARVLLQASDDSDRERLPPRNDAQVAA